MPEPVRVVLAPLVELEFEQARAWYDGQRTGLGTEFAMEVDACLERIQNAPEMVARIKKDYRQVKVQRFPYAIYYEFVGAAVRVYTVFHCSQDPAKLDERLP